jgi:uncharacterized protein
MVHRWDELTFLHWRFRAEDVQALLPAGLEVEQCDGSAWVGLVPFLIRVGLPRVRPLPWVSQFPETNVRTYVRSADGRVGIWFFSLDAARLGAVLAARSTYRLPYLWSRMRIRRSGDVVRYECRRRWPGPRGARSSATIEVGDPFEPAELSDLDHFLTARWALYSASRSGLRRAEASHDPWPLRRARALHVEDELLAAAGLPAPTGEPLVHFSDSVEVRIGTPRRVPVS